MNKNVGTKLSELINILELDVNKNVSQKNEQQIKMIEAEYSFSKLVDAMTKSYMLSHNNELNLPAELRNAAPLEPVVAIIYYQNDNITLYFYYSGDQIVGEDSYVHRRNLDDGDTLETAFEFLHPSLYDEDRVDPNYILAVEDKDKQFFGYHISAEDMSKCLS